MSKKDRVVEKGFTLIELIMVVVILGILATIAIPKFYNLHNSTKVALFKSATGALKSGLGNAYALKHGEYPTLSEVLNNTITTGGGNTENIMDASDFKMSQSAPGAGVEIIGSEPADPGDSWDAVYLYYPSESNAEYYTKIWYNADEGRVIDGL